MLLFLKSKSEYYQPKFSKLFLKRFEKELKHRIKTIFDLFDSNGYNFGEKVRLYKYNCKQKSLVQNANYHIHNKGKNQSSDRVPWIKKKYTINKDAKSNVFHILMKKANMFLFEYFYSKVEFINNECNFLGNSLINSLVQNFEGDSPTMDIAIHNEHYDRERQRKVQKENMKTSIKESDSLPIQEVLAKENYRIPKKTKPKPRQKRTTTFQKKQAYTKYSNTRNNQKNYKIHNPELENQTFLTLQKLLSLGENPDLPNKQKQFPVIRVSQSGGSDLLHLMVSFKCNLNVLDSENNNPLLLFAKRRDTQSCEYLLRNGARIDTLDRHKRNALHWSLNMASPENSNNFDLEETLLKAGVDLNQRDQDGKTPVSYLFVKMKDPYVNSKMDPIEIFSYLLSTKKVDLENMDSQGNRLIHYCAQRGAYLCMLYLLKRKVDVNAKNHHNNSALNISILNSQNDVAIILLQNDARVNESVQIVDYESLKKYHTLKKQENIKNRIQLEGSEDEAVLLGNDEAVQLENDEGLVKDAVLLRFREDEESDDWTRYIDQIRNKDKSIKILDDFDFGSDYDSKSDSEQTSVLDDSLYYNNQSREPRPIQNSKNYRDPSQIQTRNRQLRQGLNPKLNQNNEFENLSKLAEKDFIIARASQFKIALQNSMLSVNFLLIDLTFNLGRALMDTFMLQNWDYSKTLLNKKIYDIKYEYTDPKRRNALHYLAYYGSTLDRKMQGYLINSLINKKLDLHQVDCFERKPIHYAALSGNLFFIDLVKPYYSDLNQKDIFGNTLLSLYLQSHSVSKEKLLTFINEYGNDVNLQFKVIKNEYVKEVESFNEYLGNITSIYNKLQKLVNTKHAPLPWFESEKKFREQEKIINNKETPFELFSTLVYAAFKKRDMALTENLIEVGADLNAQDLNKQTILAKAIRANQLDLLEILKKHKDKIDFQKGT